MFRGVVRTTGGGMVEVAGRGDVDSCLVGVGLFGTMSAYSLSVSWRWKCKPRDADRWERTHTSKRPQIIGFITAYYD